MPGLGGGVGEGLSQSWQCQDFGSACYSNPSLMTSVIAGMKSFGIIPTEFIGSLVERGSGAKLTNLQCLRKQNLGVSTQALLPRWSPFGDFGPHGDQNDFFGPHFF